MQVLPHTPANQRIVKFTRSLYWYTGLTALLGGEAVYKHMANVLTVPYTWRQLQTHFINVLQRQWHGHLTALVCGSRNLSIINIIIYHIIIYM